MKHKKNTLRKICPHLDSKGLWRLTGDIGQTTTPWPLNNLQKKTLDDFRKAMSEGTVKFVERTKCACMAENPIHFASIDRFGLPVDSYICGNCGLVYTSPVLSPDSIKPFYEHFYHILHFGSPISKNQHLYGEGQGTKIYNFLKKWLDSKKLKVLEIGSGSGSVIKEFAKEAHKDGVSVQGVGLEYSKTYIEHFDPDGLDIKLLYGDLHTFEPKECFDVVIMSHVFEHFLDPNKELKILKKFINENSLIYIEVPGIFSLRFRYLYNCDYLKYHTFAHIYNFNLTSLTNILNRNGFGLLWGNEMIESIFSLGTQTIDTSQNANTVLSYLQDLELNLAYYQNLPSFMNTHNPELLSLKQDLLYIKRFVDSILNFYPIKIIRKIKKTIVGSY